jgi:hypothetical protein
VSATPITLTPRRSDAEVIADFEEMLEAAHVNGWADKLNCYDKPELFADYKRSPSQEEAAALCASCPLFELCEPYAVVVRRPWTVLGGVSWVEGRPFKPTAVKAQDALRLAA